MSRRPPRGARRSVPPRGLSGAVSALALLASSCGGDQSEAPVPASPPVVDVTMREYRFEYERSIPRGRVVFRVRNRGRRRHELILLQLPEGFPPIDKQLRSKQRRPIGTFGYLHPLRPGTSDAFAVELVPARYAMVDFQTGRQGVRHALRGMTSEFRVR